MSKLIGIVGGLGPKAGESLHAKILSNTRAVGDADHLPILLYTNPGVPDRGDFIFGEGDENPAYEILRSLQLLMQAGAEVLCVPCNTAHAPVIWDVVEEGFRQITTGAELLHLIQVVTDHVVHRHPNVANVGILGTCGTLQTGVYQSALSLHNIRSIAPSDAAQRGVQNAIYHPDWGIKARSTPVSEEARGALQAGALRMIADGAQAVILGCTEVPLAFTEPDLKGIPLIDSTAVLARECIRRAAGEEKLVSLPRHH